MVKNNTYFIGTSPPEGYGCQRCGGQESSKREGGVIRAITPCDRVSGGDKGLKGTGDGMVTGL